MKAKYCSLIGFLIPIVYFLLQFLFVKLGILSVRDTGILDMAGFILVMLWPLLILSIFIFLSPLLLLIKSNKMFAMFSIISGSLLILGFGLVSIFLISTITRRALGYSHYTSPISEYVFGLLFIMIFVVCGAFYLMAGIKALKECKK